MLLVTGPLTRCRFCPIPAALAESDCVCALLPCWLNGRRLQEDTGSGAAQWQFTYLTNGAYRITNVKRGSDQCDQKVLSSLPSGSSDIQILNTDDRCCSQISLLQQHAR